MRQPPQRLNLHFLLLHVQLLVIPMLPPLVVVTVVMMALQCRPCEQGLQWRKRLLLHSHVAVFRQMGTFAITDSEISRVPHVAIPIPPPNPPGTFLIHVAPVGFNFLLASRSTVVPPHFL